MLAMLFDGRPPSLMTPLNTHRHT